MCWWHLQDSETAQVPWGVNWLHAFEGSEPSNLLNPHCRICRCSRTDAGKELNDHIKVLIKSKRDEEGALENKIEEEDNEDKRETLRTQRTQLNDALNRLKVDKNKLDNPIKWEQATNDHVALEAAIKKQRDSATKDWMVGSLC